MKIGDRRVILAAAILAVALAVPVGLVAFAMWAWVMEPAHQLDLPGTRWEVVSVGQESLGSTSPTLAFDAGGSYATLSLACGDVRFSWAWDSDGSAQVFGVDDMPLACEEAPQSDALVLNAMLDVREWSIQSDGHITLLGRRDLRLERAGSS